MWKVLKPTDGEEPEYNFESHIKRLVNVMRTMSVRDRHEIQIDKMINHGDTSHFGIDSYEGTCETRGILWILEHLWQQTVKLLTLPFRRLRKWIRLLTNLEEAATIFAIRSLQVVSGWACSSFESADKRWEMSRKRNKQCRRAAKQPTNCQVSDVLVLLQVPTNTRKNPSRVASRWKNRARTEVCVFRNSNIRKTEHYYWLLYRRYSQTMHRMLRRLHYSKLIELQENN